MKNFIRDYILKKSIKVLFKVIAIVLIALSSFFLDNLAIKILYLFLYLIQPLLYYLYLCFYYIKFLEHL